MSETPCPNCGHCPTCGRSNNPQVVGPYWYWNPWGAYPYGTGYPITYSGDLTSVSASSGDCVAVNTN